MELKAAIQQEHSKAQCDKIVAYIGQNEKRFATLMQLFFGPDTRITQRAAWPMSYCVQQHPALITPYLGKLVTLLQTPGTHPAITRNITRLLQEVALPQRYHGKVMDACFNFIANITTPAAIKAFSLTILHRLSSEYPDIKNELKLVIEERWPYETPAFKSRARKILKALAQ